jgi:hypothetical protein
MTTTTSLAAQLVKLRLRPEPVACGPWPPALATAVGLGLALIGMSRSKEGDISGLGLISALDPLYFAGLIAIVIGAVAELMSPRSRRWWFGAHVVVLAFVLHGVTGIVEANPRFPTAYLHVGFADQIARNGELLQDLDARFSWPGFFAGSALLQQATGGAPVTWAMRFFPLAVNLGTVALIDVLGRVAHVSLHRRRAAQLLFLTCNWIGQDYFSPQATASLLYLVAVILVVVTFPEGGLSVGLRSLTGARASRSLPPRSRAERGAVMAAICLLTAALVMGHQITPGFLAISMVAFALTGQTSLRAFPFAIAASTIGWLSFAAQPYWTGHLQKLTGSAGRLSTLVQKNVTERATTGNFDRGIVVQSRLAFTILLILVAAVSLYFLRRQRAVPVLLACLVIAPWPMLLLQAYGGEMALRILLVSLPALSLLAASVLLPARRQVRWHHLVPLAVVLLVLTPAFLVARYGNEKYERVSSDDLLVLQQAYAQHGTALVMTANSKEPRFFRRVDEVRFISLSSQLPADIVAETGNRGNYDTRFVFLGETQDAAGVALKGNQPGWTRTLEEQLIATGRFTVAAHRGESVLLRLVPARSGRG